MVGLIDFHDDYYAQDGDRYDGPEFDDLEYAEYDAICDGDYADSLEAIEAAMLAWDAQHGAQFDPAMPF